MEATTMSKTEKIMSSYGPLYDIFKDIIDENGWVDKRDLGDSYHLLNRNFYTWRYYDEVSRIHSRKYRPISLRGVGYEDKIPSELLSKYGEVTECKIVHPSSVIIQIGKGYTPNNGVDHDPQSVHTHQLIQECVELFPEYPRVTTCRTEKNFALVVITKSDQL